MRAGCIAQCVAGLGSFGAQRGGRSTARLKSGAVKSWKKTILGAPRFSPHRTLGHLSVHGRAADPSGASILTGKAAVTRNIPGAHVFWIPDNGGNRR